MLKGFNQNGDLEDVIVENGAILMKMAGSGDEGLNVNLSNASDLIPETEKETTLYAGVSTIGASEITIGVSDKVSEISIANYSETASVSMSVDNKNFVIAPGMALDLPINKNVGVVGISATEEDTTVQYVIKGILGDISKTIELTNNGSHNVMDYDYATVNVFNDFFLASVGQGSTGGNNGIAKIIKHIPSTLQCSSNMSKAFTGCYNLLDFPLLDTSSVTNMEAMFNQCQELESIPLLNTGNVTNMNSTFASCTKLEDIPVLDTSKVTSFSNTFVYCNSLSNDSLNNIMQMCINATSYTGTKTLATLGITSTQATACQGLSNYNDFLAAGWTTGY